MCCHSSDGSGFNQRVRSQPRDSRESRTGVRRGKESFPKPGSVVSAYHRDAGFQEAGTPGAPDFGRGTDIADDSTDGLTYSGGSVSSDTARLSLSSLIFRNVPDRDVCQKVVSLYALRRLDRRR